MAAVDCRNKPALDSQPTAFYRFSLSSWVRECVFERVTG